jgi:all-trans-retinol 13,14-reductase
MTGPAIKEYDFVIIGSGLGGLVCAYILASEGYSVIILEKNHQIGGNLQVFSRDKCVLDTGVHYMGGLNEGENLHQFFKYFGILDKLKLKKLSEDFDIIRFDDGKEYALAQGYPAFIKNLTEYFPEEEKAIIEYCDQVKYFCDQFPMYNLEDGPADYLRDEIVGVNAYDHICSITSNDRLRNVLAGMNLLYAGVKGKTPFYLHALIVNSYILGSYRPIDGGSQIAIQLTKAIRDQGGEIRKRCKVVSANYFENGYIKEIVLEGGETIVGKKFISNIHPDVTIDIFGEERFLSVYKKRIRTLENTIAPFMVYFIFKKNTFKYLNHNIYQYHNNDVWETGDYTEDNWPLGYFLCTPASSKNSEYADSLSVMTYMHFSEVEQWADSFHTMTTPASRDESYYQFKKTKEELVLKKVETIFPGIRSKIRTVYSASPLTFRDYIGNKDGAMYGIVKNSQSPTQTFINTKTKIPNLYLTGQNISLHGILGVTIGAFVTCFAFVDKEKLINKIKSV